MSDGVSLTEFTSLHASESADTFVAKQASHFLLVEPLGPSATRATTELLPEGERDTHDAESADILVFPVTSSEGARAAITLGRAQDSDIRIDSPAVSKTHLSFRLGAPPEAPTVSDAGSHNGTTLNGRVLESGISYPISDGDVLEISRRFRAVFLGSRSLHARLGEAAATGVRAQPSRHFAEERSPGILTGKVAVITGGGRGLGRAYALRFAEEGCRVVVNDVGAAPDGTGTDFTVAGVVVSEIEQAGGVAAASLHDVSRAADVEALFQFAKDRFGGVDILVCSAGALHAGSSVLDMDIEIWERLMATNARGTFLCVQAAARLMVEQKRAGRIITTSSLAAMNGNAGLVGYAASKAAIYALSKTAALELDAYGITVNTLTPMAWTRLTSAIPAIASIPRGDEVLSARYVADVALFLASDLSLGITGQVVDVGGPQLSFYRMVQSAPVQPKEERWTPQELQRRWHEITNER
ncbi:MAG TPA: SDR family NAD(P)-dependent oxidoreductase [Polyangiaceae bacterium]|nr:SDR family NAD(P)-dependent oxidoreductase [Polyangiaceae bacterium]